MAEVTSEGVSALVRSQLEEILGSVEGRQRFGLTSRFTPEHEDRLDWLEKSVRGFQNDYTLGRVMSGPTWISGTSIMDGTITADKLLVNTLESITVSTGNLNVTGNFIAAASFPAVGARIETNSLGIWGYSGAATTTFKFNTDGSGSIGTAPNNISWNTSGVLSVPIAVIGSLTIADVGSGVIGGTYQSSLSTTRFEMSPTSFRALSLGTETFKLDALTGAVTMTGNFTVRSAASGARVVVSNAGGLEGYNSGGTRTFLLNAATGSGHLGNATFGISWNDLGTVSIGGVAFSGGKITASSMSVSQLSLINADAGTITAGTINASVINTGTLLADRISGGTVAGGFALGLSDLTINSTGKIRFGTSALDYLANDALHFEMSAGETGKVDFSRSGFAPEGALSAFVTSSEAYMKTKAQYTAARYAEQITSGNSTGPSIWLRAIYTSAVADAQILLSTSSSGGNIAHYINSQTVLELQTTNYRAVFKGRIYPGNGTAQTSVYIDADTSDLGVWLGGTADTNEFMVRNSSGTVRFMVSGTGKVGISNTATATSVSGLTRVWPIYDAAGSALGYIPIYSGFAGL